MYSYNSGWFFVCYPDPYRIPFMVVLSASGSGQMIRIRSNPDPDPQHWSSLFIECHIILKIFTENNRYCIMYLKFTNPRKIYTKLFWWLWLSNIKLYTLIHRFCLMKSLESYFVVIVASKLGLFDLRKSS